MHQCHKRSILDTLDLFTSYQRIFQLTNYAIRSDADKKLTHSQNPVAKICNDCSIVGVQIMIIIHSPFLSVYE